MSPESRPNVSPRELVAQSWQPSSAEINRFMTTTIALYTNGTLDGLRKERNTYQQQLETVRQDYQKDHGREPSRALLCSRFIAGMWLDHLQEEVDISFRGKKFQQYAVEHDLYFGEREMLYYLFIPLAVREEGVNPEKASALMATASESFNTSELDDINSFLTAQRNTQEGLALLNQDPNGFLLLESRFKALRERPSQQFQPMVKEFVIAGAKLIQDIYKYLYPLSKKV